MSDDPEFRPLDPRVIPLDRIIGLIGAGVVSAASLFGVLLFQLAADGLAPWRRLAVVAAWLVVVAALTWQAYRWPVKKYARLRYRVDDQGIEIRRGVYWREVVNVPKSRVQHTDVTQGPIERRFGLGTLVIYTAGTAYARVELDGLEHGDALRIRTYLLPRSASDAV